MEAKYDSLTFVSTLSLLSFEFLSGSEVLGFMSSGDKFMRTAPLGILIGADKDPVSGFAA